MQILYICFLKWPPQHRYGNSNLVRRFGMNTTTRQTRIPKLFLTAQTVNPPRFPLHVPNESIADKHPINIHIFCRKLRFPVKGFCALFSAFKIRSGTQFHGCTDLSTLCRDKSHTYLPLPQIVCL